MKGDTVVDLFMGSGTLCELDRIAHADDAQARVQAEREGR